MALKNIHNPIHQPMTPRPVGLRALGIKTPLRASLGNEHIYLFIIIFIYETQDLFYIIKYATGVQLIPNPY